MVPVPPASEMEVLVQQVSTAMTGVGQCLEAYARTSTALDTLEQSLLAKAFRGELVPQDLSDEPAPVLLQRIWTADATAESVASRPPRQPGSFASARQQADETPGKTQVMAIHPESSRAASKDVDDLHPDALLAQVFTALWTLGPLHKDEAVRRVADHLREGGYVRFERLRSDGALFAAVLDSIELAVKAGRLDRPRRGCVRACKLDAADYTTEDWRHALVASLGAEPIDRDEAVRAAAEWAREHMGLAFERLRADGQIAEGLRSAINSAIRRGEVIRHDARRISRAQAVTQSAPTRVTQGRA